MSAEQEVSGGNGNEWSTLSQTWQAQEVSAIDVEKLRAQAQRRGRRLRWALAVEVVMTLGLLAYLMHTGWPSAKSDGQRWLLAALTIFLLIYQGWSLWLRRRQFRNGGLDAHALLMFEIDRARTSVLYWRVGVWVSLLMVVALTLASLQFWFLASTEIKPAKMAGAWVGSAVATVACAIFAWGYGRFLRARIERLQQMLREMGEG